MNKLAATPAPARPGMRTGTGIFLVTAGSLLLFALRSGSPHWVNLHIVGVILILAGVLGLLLPRLARAPRDLLRRWVIPAGRPAKPAPHRLLASKEYRDTSPALVREPGRDDPTLADQILDFEHDLPV